MDTSYLTELASVRAATIFKVQFANTVTAKLHFKKASTHPRSMPLCDSEYLTSDYSDHVCKRLSNN